MRVLGLFDKYFLILMIIQGMIAIVVDSRSYASMELAALSAKAKRFGITIIILSVALYIAKKILT